MSCLAWSSDDTRLASAGAGGACYQWDIPGGVKIAKEEYVDKQRNYCWVQFCGSGTADGLVLRSLDGKLQHIQVGAAASCRLRGSRFLASKLQRHQWLHDNNVMWC